MILYISQIQILSMTALTISIESTKFLDFLFLDDWSVFSMRFSDVLPFKGQLPLCFSTIASLSPTDALGFFWVHFLCYDAAVAYFDQETDLLIYNDQIFFLGIILETLMNHNSTYSGSTCFTNFTLNIPNIRIVGISTQHKGIKHTTKVSKRRRRRVIEFARLNLRTNENSIV